MGNQMEQIEKPASATSPVNVASKDSAAGNAPEGPPEKKDASNTASSAPSPLKRGGSVDSKTGGPTKKRKSAVDEEPKNGKPGNENPVEQIEKPHVVVPASAASSVNVASKDSDAGNAPAGPSEKKDVSNPVTSTPSPLKKEESVDSKTGGPTNNENPVKQIEKPHEVVPASAASSVNVASKDGVAGNAPAGPSEKKDASNPATKAHSPLNKGKKKKSTEGIRVKN